MDLVPLPCIARPHEAARPVLALRDVAVDYGDATPLAGVTCTLGPQPVAVTGPSGSGKSTLLRVLAGEQVPDQGTVTLDGEPVKPRGWRSSPDLRIATVHQDHRLIPFLGVGDNLRFAAEVRGHTITDGDVETSLAAVGLGDIDPRRAPETLSGGQQQRVAIARALCARARVVLADEPTGALDAETTDGVTDLLLDIAAREGVLVVVATHDPVVAVRFPDRVHVDGGELTPC